MSSSSMASLILAISLLPALARAQTSLDNFNNGASYGERIGVGVGIACAGGLCVVLAGWLIRRRRRRAFLRAYPPEFWAKQREAEQGEIEGQQARMSTQKPPEYAQHHSDHFRVEHPLYVQDPERPGPMRTYNLSGPVPTVRAFLDRAPPTDASAHREQDELHLSMYQTVQRPPAAAMGHGGASRL